MKLNKLQRHTAYMIMLAIAETKECGDCIDGLCDIYEVIFGSLPYCIRYEERSNRHGFDYHLPELWAKRTTEDWCGVWFNNTDSSNWNNRKKLLKQCIEETY